MSLKFVSSISTTRCQALFGQSAAHRSKINFQVPRMCSVKLHSTQFNTCYHSNDNVSVIFVCNNWTLAHCFFSSSFSFFCLLYFTVYIYVCMFCRIFFTTSWWIKIYINLGCREWLYAFTRVLLGLELGSDVELAVLSLVGRGPSCSRSIHLVPFNQSQIASTIGIICGPILAIYRSHRHRGLVTGVRDEMTVKHQRFYWCCSSVCLLIYYRRFTYLCNFSLSR